MKNIYKTVKKTKNAALLLMAGASVMVFLSLDATSHAEQESAKVSFTEEQKAEINTMLEQFVNDNPEIIMKSVRQYLEKEEKKHRAKAALSAKEGLEKYKNAFEDENLPVMGNPDGDITIVEFFDYNCGYCKKAFADLLKLVERDKNVRVVLQDLPILSPTSAEMSKLSLAAHKQGKYFEMHKALMEHRGGHNMEVFLKLAEDIGLDIEQLKEDAKSKIVEEALAKSREISQTLGIRGTPGFIVGDKIFPGYVRLEGMLDIIKKAREAQN